MTRFDADTAVYKFESKLVEFMKTIISKKPLVYKLVEKISDGLKTVIFGNIFPETSTDDDTFDKRKLTKQL